MSIAQTGEGFGHAPAYTVPGLPWVSGSIVLDTTPMHLRFSKVTRSIRVSTMSGSSTRVGFTSNGVNGSNFYRVPSGSSVEFDLRVTEMYVRMDAGSGEIDVLAGLTTIPVHQMGLLTGSLADTSFPGAGWQGVG